jgi:hypothetical protein
VGEQIVVAFQRQFLPLMVKATVPIPPQTVAVMRRLDHVADRAHTALRVMDLIWLPHDPKAK